MPKRQHWALIGGAAGFLIGVGDGLFFMMLGLEVRFREGDPTVLWLISYALTVGILGFAVGRWMEARKDSQDNEKLASIGRMAAGVAHEVRNPLAVIRSSAGLLLEGMPDEEGDERQAATFIVEEVDRLDTFVRALLDFSRPMNAEPRPTDVSALVEQLGDRSPVPFEGMAESVTAKADPVLLSQLLLSLVVNAGEAESGRIVVRARAVGRDLVVDVADDGSGIPVDERERIFEPFFTTKARGTGLGLPMAARTAEALGGALEVIEGGGLGDAGQGACFRLRLPGAAA